MNKKGFLFVVSVFLILTYIMLSISVWVKSVEVSESAYAEFYKESTVELAIEQITPAKVDRVSNVVMNRALYSLNEHAILHEIKTGPAPAGSDPGNEDLYIEMALGELLVNGTASGDYFIDGEPINDPQSSMSAWAANLNSSLEAIGVHVEHFSISHFRAEQQDIDVIAYSFDMDLAIQDYSGTSSLSRSYSIANSVNITGLVDPALARESRNTVSDDLGAYRQFFFNKQDYPAPSSAAPQKLASVVAGQGWLYGPVVSVSDIAPIPLGERSRYILVGSFPEFQSIPLEASQGFAAFIMTSDPVKTASPCLGDYDESQTLNPLRYDPNNCQQPEYQCSSGICTSKPFVIAPGFSISDAGPCPVFTANHFEDGRCVLMVAGALVPEVDSNHELKLDRSDAGVFNIENMRDVIMCGYYMKNPDAPSYMQRLMEDPYLRADQEFGIERFVIGEYANHSFYDGRSRVDHEIFNTTIGGTKIRGMPGCRDPETCADEPVTGIFSVSDDVIEGYGLDAIACDNDAAGCDG